MINGSYKMIWLEKLHHQETTAVQTENPTFHQLKTEIERQLDIFEKIF